MTSTMQWLNDQNAGGGQLALNDGYGGRSSRRSSAAERKAKAMAKLRGKAPASKAQAKPKAKGKAKAKAKPEAKQEGEEQNKEDEEEEESSSSSSSSSSDSSTLTESGSESDSDEERDWFERIFGFTEFETMDGSLAEYRKARAHFQYNRKTGRLRCNNGRKESNWPQWQAGWFRRPKLQELRENFKKLAPEVNALLGGKKIRLREEIGDVSEMHIKRENKYAIFQVASQFNALEHLSEEELPEHGITIYAHDHTQGPACATACAPGTIVRNYFAFTDGGQTKDRQIQNLEEIERLLNNKKNQYFNVKSGYTMSSDDQLEKLYDRLRDDELVEELKKNLYIGEQSETEVVSSKFGEVKYRGPKQVVSQAYCSAVSVSYSECDPDLWEPFARMILEGAYEATMYMAIENALRHKGEFGSKKVFLTALGGGVFGNDMAWIEDAMSKAFEKFNDLGLEVVMISYDQSTPEFARLARKFPKKKANAARRERDGRR